MDKEVAMPAGLETATQDGALRVIATGDWTIQTAEGIRKAIGQIVAGSERGIAVDLSGLGVVDTVGALLVRRLRDQLSQPRRNVDLTGLQEKHAALLERVMLAGEIEPLEAERRRSFFEWVERVGRASCDAYREAADLLDFLGVMAVSVCRSIVRPTRIRFISVFSHIERVGFNALPIVGLLSFLIGIVVAYQGTYQLRRFGAEIFTIDLLGVSVLREMGILLAAIVIAGRSGSAFAAQIGTMQVTQEIDAMRTLGLDPVELLVLPRLIALLIAMPLLAVYADVMGLLGGGVMVIVTLDVSFFQFLEHLQSAVPLANFWIGLVKAPIFGCVIALTGCREGLKVTGSAESVGHHTTRAVVISIFLVIVADALFSILFSPFGI
jgi:phospholipid/cholesterol/gamma-HCH transport system permease protein